MEYSFTVFFIVIFAAFHSGESIQCYSCNTKSDPNCMEGDKLESFKTDCNSKAVEDAKKAFNTVSQTLSDWSNQLGLNVGKAATIDADLVCQKVDIENKDQKYTLRSCSIAKKDSESMCEILKKQLTSDTVKVHHCSQCTDNLCNSSNGVAPALFTIFIVLATVVFNNNQ